MSKLSDEEMLAIIKVEVYKVTAFFCLFNVFLTVSLFSIMVKIVRGSMTFPSAGVEAVLGLYMLMLGLGVLFSAVKISKFVIKKKKVVK